MAARRAVGMSLEALGQGLEAYFRQKSQQEEIAARQKAARTEGGDQKDSDFVHDVMKEVFKNSPVTAAQQAGIKLDNRDPASSVLSEISKAKSPSEAISPEEALAQYQAKGGRDTLSSRNIMRGSSGLRSEENPGGDQQVNAITQAATNRSKMLQDEANKPNQVVYAANEDGSKSAVGVNPRSMPAGGVQTALPAQIQAAMEAKAAQAKKQAELSPDIVAAEAAREGAITGAREKAQLPFQLQLAQVRANIAFKAKTEWDDWQAAHPKATPEERRKAGNAVSALGTSQELRAMLEALDKKGTIGPIAGRLQQVAVGKIKSEDLTKLLMSDGVDADSARLASDYYTKTKLLASLAAVTHGGARGGGSIQMVKQFEQVLSPIGDKSVILGQLDALDSLMIKYKDHPNEVQPDLNIPGLNPASTASPAEDKLKQLREGKTGSPPVSAIPGSVFMMPSHKVGGLR